MKTRIFVFCALALSACSQGGAVGKSSALGVAPGGDVTAPSDPTSDPGVTTTGSPDAGVPDEPVVNNVLVGCNLDVNDLTAYPLGEVDNFDTCSFSFSTSFPDLAGYLNAAESDPNADPGALAIAQELHCSAADGRALDLSLALSAVQADAAATFSNSDGTVDVPSDLAGLYVQRAMYICGQVGKLGMTLN